MAKLEPMVFICFPEPSESKEMAVRIHYKELPKWVQLYILRWWERRYRKC